MHTTSGLGRSGVSPDFLGSYPPPHQPRPEQAEFLELLSRNWHDYDVFVAVLPTAFGKTSLARAVAAATGNCLYLTPTNQLLEQMLRTTQPGEFNTLARLDSYTCATARSSCASVRGRRGGFCRGCPASAALVAAKYRRGNLATNYHTALAQKLRRDVVVVDEAHNLTGFVRDLSALKIWRSKYKYPFSREKLLGWVQSLPGRTRKSKKMRALEQALTSPRPQYVVDLGEDSWLGGGGDTRRGEEDIQHCLRLLPTDIRNQPALGWLLGDARKVILMSATLSTVDVEQLGLSRRRVLYLQCPSPIPPGSRPQVFRPLYSASHANQEECSSILAQHLAEVILPQHEGEKGLVHATYQQAEQLRACLQEHPRLIFHSRHNKQEMFRMWQDSPPEDGAVLVGSGMVEGIDLPGDLARFQVVGKIPWPSLADPATKYLAESNPVWYNWETWKQLLQASGRVCRTPDDFGVTYILDGSLSRLDRSLAPRWWLDAVVDESED